MVLELDITQQFGINTYRKVYKYIYLDANQKTTCTIVYANEDPFCIIKLI